MATTHSPFGFAIFLLLQQTKSRRGFVCCGSLMHKNTIGETGPNISYIGTSFLVSPTFHFHYNPTLILVGYRYIHKSGISVIFIPAESSLLPALLRLSTFLPIPIPFHHALKTLTSWTSKSLITSSPPSTIRATFYRVWSSYLIFTLYYQWPILVVYRYKFHGLQSRIMEDFNTANLQ